MRWLSRSSGRVVLAGALAFIVALALAPPAHAGGLPIARPSTDPPRPVPADGSAAANPDATLGSGWRQSTDRAVASTGDAWGLHILVADRKAAYRWRSVATLVEPGLDTDQWTGRFCVTASGQRAVVVYAPRQFANREALMLRGAFVATVDLTTGAVHKSPGRVALAYYNPTCGAGEQAVVSRLTSSAAGTMTTTFDVVNAVDGRIARATTVNGQLSGAVPVGDAVVATRGRLLLSINAKGTESLLAESDGVPFRLQADGARGVVFQQTDGANTTVRGYRGNGLTTLARGRLGAIRLQSGAGGRSFVVGPGAPKALGAKVGGLPVLDASVESTVSTEGKIAVESAGPDRNPSTAPRSSQLGQIRISAKLDSGQKLSFRQTLTAPSAGSAASPASGLGGAAPAAKTTGLNNLGSPNETWDSDAACAIPRNDPSYQVYQPSPQQVEWAANNAVLGNLTISRPANWNNLHLPSFSPQGLFPQDPLPNNGRVPAQILLGILAQESNQRQASWHVVDGSGGNPLTSLGFYGVDPVVGDLTTIDFTSDRVDCGYGVGQLTTGMRKSDTWVTLTALQQSAVALDYATNIAASLRILEQKWNQTRQAGLIANDGNPAFIENWWFAIWAYNSGFYPQDPANPSNPWGVGWLNNPANPVYPADRQPYLTAAQGSDTEAYDNAKHPSDWSYPERVIGWAHRSQILPDYSDGSWGPTYAPGLWPIGGFTAAQPGHNVFCVPNLNNCDPAHPRQSQLPQYSDQPPGPCQPDELRMCWWHSPVTWTDCAATCGTGVLSYNAIEPRPYVDTLYPPQCDVVGLPSSAIIIDDVDLGTPTGPGGCERDWANQGSFRLDFTPVAGPNSSIIYPSKVDFHQLSSGFGGHQWFAHTNHGSSILQTTGTWTPSNLLNGWARVLVHVPDAGAWTQQARYVITTGFAGPPKERYLSTQREKDTWISLGAYQFSNAGAQSVSLSNVTADGRGVDDISWDAVAFVPLVAKPTMVVAMGDSYISGEGAGSYYAESDQGYGSQAWNACRRSALSWPRKTKLPGMVATLGSIQDIGDPNVEFTSVACSGSTASKMGATSNPDYWTTLKDLDYLDTHAEGQFHEISQIESGAITPDTDVVLLSAGGNDANFPGTLSECALGDCTPNENQYRNAIDTAVARVDQLIGDIRAIATHAKIVLVGYPRLFDTSHLPNCNIGLTGGEMDELNRLADYMRDKQRDMVASPGHTGVSFVDMVQGFGNNGVCDPLGSSDLNPVVIGTTGPGDFAVVNDRVPQPCWSWWIVEDCVSRTSLHPDSDGTDRYATTVTAALTTIL